MILHGAAVVVGGGFDAARAASRPPSRSGFAQADADFLAAQGFNVVRLGMFFRGYSPAAGRLRRRLPGELRAHPAPARARGDLHAARLPPGPARAALQRPRLRRLVPASTTACRTRAQPFPQGYFANPALNRAYDNLWANAAGPGGVGLQDHFAEGWARVAARVRRRRTRVLGYDIFNEPWPGQRLAGLREHGGLPARRLRPDRS